MSAINPVSINSQGQSPNFKGERKTRLVSVSQGDGYEARVYETDASKGKKWGLGLASATIPGLGQAINGQWGKGIGFFVGANFIPMLLGGVAGLFSLAKAKTPKQGQAGIIGALIAFYVTALGGRIWSAVDAAKNAKTETVQIVPKSNVRQTKISSQIA